MKVKLLEKSSSILSKTGSRLRKHRAMEEKDKEQLYIKTRSSRNVGIKDRKKFVLAVAIVCLSVWSHTYQNILSVFDQSYITV